MPLQRLTNRGLSVLVSHNPRKNDPKSLAAKIVELINDPKRCAAMGLYGRRRVENELEWRYEVPKLLAAYESLRTRPTAVLPRRDTATP